MNLAASGPHDDKKQRTYPLYTRIWLLFSILILLTGAVISGVSYLSARKAAKDAADRAITFVNMHMVATINSLYAPMDTLVSLLARQQIIHATTLEERLKSLDFFCEGLDHNPQISAVYVGYSNGDFFLVRHLRREATRTVAKAPKGATYLVQSIDYDDAGKLQGSFLFYDANLKLIKSENRPDYAFDPRTRPWWFKQAPGRSIHVDPYLFFTTREIGQTFAYPVNNGKTIVAVDLTLKELSENLGRQKITPSTELAIFDSQGHILGYKGASSFVGANNSAGNPTLKTIRELDVPVLKQVYDLALAGQTGKSHAIRKDGQEWYLCVQPLEAQAPEADKAAKTFLAVASPSAEVFAHAIQTRNKALLITLAILLLVLPVTWWLARHVTKPLKDLSRQTKDMQNLLFTTPDTEASPIREIEQLSVTISSMKRRIRKFLEISESLASEQDLDRLLDYVVSEAITIGAAAGGAVYLLEQNGHTLVPSALRTSEGPLALELQQPVEITAANALTKAVSALTSQVVAMDGADVEMTCFNSQNPERKDATLLFVPLSGRSGASFGSIVLFYPAPLAAPASELMMFIESLAHTASISIGNHIYEWLSTIDTLTGVYNRRYAEKRFFEEFQRALRKGTSLGCLMLDIDYFKQINDQHGHLAGDRILKHVADTIVECLRSYDIVYRYGGEEFMAVLPEIELPEIVALAERVRHTIAEQSAAEIPVTVSIGATVSQENDAQGSDMIQRADQALYNAKNSGRNRVETL